ncbi:MAG: hypothetical protein EB127_09815 [Alphaproteobacteria bacterium]|nr:hypothetical protein [Alphaproteobacteria bacterium]
MPNNKPQHPKETYINIGLAMSSDMMEDLKMHEAEKILIIGSYSEEVRTLLTPLNAEIQFLPTYKYQKLEHKYDVIISFLDIPKIRNLANFMLWVKELLDPTGILIGCFAGELSMMQTRIKLWNIEEEAENGFSNRIRPMIRLTDFNNVLYHFGLQNITSFKDQYNVGPGNLYDYIKYIRECGENGYWGIEEQKPLRISKKLCSAILGAKEVYNDTVEIICFCASNSTRFFTNLDKL